MPELLGLSTSKVKRNSTKSPSPDPDMEAQFRTLLQDLQESMSTPTCNAIKLNGKNFHKWKRDMTLYLRSANLWAVVTENVDAAERDARWTRKNDKALNDIHNACDADQQDLIMELEMAKDAWDKLKEIYETSDAPSIQRLYNEFNNIRKKSEESMACYIARVNSASRALVAVGENVLERNIMNRLIEGLNKDYETLKIGLSLIENLSLRRLTSLLLGDESRKALEKTNSSMRRSASPAKKESPKYRERTETNKTSALWCPNCQLSNHNIDTCFTLHPELLVKRRKEQIALRQQNQNKPAQQIVAGRPVATVQAKAQTITQVAAFADANASPYANPAEFVQTQKNGEQTERMWDQWAHAMAMESQQPYDHEIHSIAMSVETEKTSDSPKFGGQWLMDSGASNHYTSNRSILTDFKECKNVNVMTGHGVINARGVGNVTVHTSVGIRKIYDVMWVPDLTGKNNLLSIAQLARKGCKVCLENPKATVLDKGGNCLAEGTFSGKGWLLNMSACEPFLKNEQAEKKAVMGRMPEVAMLAGVEDQQPIEIWHLRLGHLNQKAITKLVSRSIGMSIGAARAPTLTMDCEPCLRGAQHKTISSSRGIQATRKLEHVWTDVKGPLLDKDIYGFHFFVTFIDEFTRLTVVFPLEKKSDVFNAFKLFEARAERMGGPGNSILNIHCDGGGEYMSNEFRAYLRNKGIHVFNTQPYAPEMNSLAERLMRTIIEHASAMLWAARLPIGFWASAVKTAVFLYNRSPHSALLNEMTPFEAWFGRKPEVGHLKIFGCRAAAHVPDELRSKVDWTSKSSPDCIFIGYSETQNLYELWDVVKKDVIRKRDVIFWENELGHNILHGFALPHGISIFPGVAGQIMDRMNDEVPVNVPMTNVGPANALPLVPVAGKQDIQALAPEPKKNELTFISFVPQVEAPPVVPVLARPSLNVPVATNNPVAANVNVGGVNVDLRANQVIGSVANYAEMIDMLDNDFMETLYATDVIDEAKSFDVDARDSFVLSEKETTNIRMIPLDDRELPKTYKGAMRLPTAKRWKKAMEKQIALLKENETWELVDLPKGRKAFPNKWVFDWVRSPKVLEERERVWKEELLKTGLKPGDGKFEEELLGKMKESGDVIMEKARLVARGDLQKEGMDYKDTFAPVVKFVSLRVLLARAAQHFLVTRNWDIVSAFLHGEIDMETYMQQPQGFSDGTNKVCRLKKAIYGLCQAARQFYIKLDDILTNIGYKRLACDWAIWVGESGSFIAVHVDDMACAGINEQLVALKTAVEKHLVVKDLGPIAFYLGIAICYDIKIGAMYLTQAEYSRKLLEEYGMQAAHPVATPMLDGDRDQWDKDDTEVLNDVEQKRYQALVGSLLYLMHGSRPDICYCVIKLSQYAAKPRIVHWEGLKRILRYIKGTIAHGIILGNVSAVRDKLRSGGEGDVRSGDEGTNDGAKEMNQQGELIGYFDSAHADNASRRSTCGYLFLLNGAPISWATKVQKTVALSTTEAEYMAGTEAAREAIWIRSLLLSLDPGKPQSATELRGDNQGSLALAKNPVFHQRTKHIDIRHRFLSECVERGVIYVSYVPTKDMLADGLTKALSKDSVRTQVKGIGMCQEPPNWEGSKKRKYECSHCGNLYKDAYALSRHMLMKES